MTNPQLTWDEYFLKMALLVSSKSKDRSTKVGAVIVSPDNAILSTGYNGFPRGVDDNTEHYHERPLKYKVTEHGERNAIYNAANEGIRLKGSKIYLSWGLYPCSDCARGIRQSGIIEVIGIKNRPFLGRTVTSNMWEDDFAVSKTLLEQSGVFCREVEVDLSCIS